MLDELEQQRLALTGRLITLPATSIPAPMPPPLNGGILTSAIAAVRNMLATRENPADEAWISIARQVIQKVVIAPSKDDKSADLTIHGRLAAILAGQEAWRDVSRHLREEHSTEFVSKLDASKIKTLAEKTKFLLPLCKALLAERRRNGCCYKCRGLHRGLYEISLVQRQTRHS
ncbi:hypothetical protein JNB71_15570 [Rhizobium herbae]|uniref:DUF3102 domain-containing protein n=1 Tax=Rhizobium herbae TaxID=508661 RepID=A0ABS7HC44_9HYPH|nr:hypothetical protein [Rhizobium herbae]MBW9064733.1 hypothetical protein [Rhizobium herbae]